MDPVIILGVEITADEDAKDRAFMREGWLRQMEWNAKLLEWLVKIHKVMDIYALQDLNRSAFGQYKLSKTPGETFGHYEDNGKPKKKEKRVWMSTITRIQRKLKEKNNAANQ